jgi:hypothetical protein
MTFPFVFTLLITCVFHSLAKGDFLAGQNVVDDRLELLSDLSDIKEVQTSSSNLATDVLVAQIFFKNWQLTVPINNPAFSVGEVEFEWIVSIDIDGDLKTGTRANHPFPGSDFELRARRIRDNGISGNSTIGPNIMTSQLWQYASATNSFVVVPTVTVLENSFSAPMNTGTGAPAVHWFRMQCPVAGLTANSRLGVHTYHRVPPFNTYRDYTEQNVFTYLPLVRSTASLVTDKVRLQFENLSPQIRYGIETSSNLSGWTLTDQIFVDNAGELITLDKTLVNGSRFFRAVILPQF